MRACVMPDTMILRISSNMSSAIEKSNYFKKLFTNQSVLGIIHNVLDFIENVLDQRSVPICRCDTVRTFKKSHSA